jgi:hypothetical protein
MWELSRWPRIENNELIKKIAEHNLTYEKGVLRICWYVYIKSEVKSYVWQLFSRPLPDFSWSLIPPQSGLHIAAGCTLNNAILCNPRNSYAHRAAPEYFFHPLLSAITPALCSSAHRGKHREGGLFLGETKWSQIIRNCSVKTHFPF